MGCRAGGAGPQSRSPRGRARRRGRKRRAKRISLSIAHVPIWVDVMYLMFEKSKVNRAPSSERSSSSLSRCSRSSRNRSRSTRCSQSTALGPNVRIAIPRAIPSMESRRRRRRRDIMVSLVQPHPTPSQGASRNGRPVWLTAAGDGGVESQQLPLVRPDERAHPTLRPPSRCRSALVCSNLGRYWVATYGVRHADNTRCSASRSQRPHELIAPPAMRTVGPTSGELGSCERDEVPHVHAAAGTVVRSGLPRLHSYRTWPDVTIPEAEHRTTRLTRKHICLVEDRLRRSIGSVDPEAALPRRALTAVQVTGIAHVRPGSKLVPVVVVPACAHPAGRLTKSAVEYHDDVVEVALVAGDEAVTVLLYVPVHMDAIRLTERRSPVKDDGVNRTQSAANPGGAVQSMTWLTVSR